MPRVRMTVRFADGTTIQGEASHVHHSDIVAFEREFNRRLPLEAMSEGLEGASDEARITWSYWLAWRTARRLGYGGSFDEFVEGLEDGPRAIEIEPLEDAGVDPTDPGARSAPGP